MGDTLPGSCYVLLHIGTGPSSIEKGTSPPLVVSGSDRFPLTNDILIERLDENTAKNIQQACEPPHYKIDNYIRDRHLYGFVQRDDNARAPEDLFTGICLPG